MNENMKNQGSTLYEQQEHQLSRHSDEFLQMLQRRGIVKDESIEDDKIAEAEQEKKRLLYHNTKAVLKHYRGITWALSTFPKQISEELELPFKDLDTLISRVDAEIGFNNRRLEYRLESIKKSRMLLDRLYDAMSVLKQKPKSGQMMYDIIYETYMTPESLKIPEILYQLNLSSRHYYRLRPQAINILSIRLWAAPGATLDSWLEVLAILEN